MSRFVFPVAGMPAIQDIATEVENAFDHFFRGANEEGAKSKMDRSVAYTPRMDLVEFEDRYEVALDLPGVDPAEVKIELHEQRLSILGERKRPTVAGDAKVWRSERAEGKFRRVVQLPESIDGDSIDAVYDAGILQVTIRKVAKPSPRQIVVRTKGADVNAIETQGSDSNAS